MPTFGTLFATCACLALVLPWRAAGQAWEFGFAGGGSFYLDKSVTSGGASASAGFRPGFLAAAWIGHNSSPQVSGEIRYTFLKNDLQVSSASTRATLGAQAHAVEYNIHVHLTPDESATRPYVLAGGGMKGYHATGEDQPFQDLMQFAILTSTTEWKPFASVGVGIKHRVGARTVFRVEFRNQFSAFPKEVILPSPLSGGISGLVHNFQASAGIGYTF
jgi:hypothetical protein